MRVTEVWFWWSQFLAQKGTVCLQNVLQLLFFYWTESRCIQDQCYLCQDLCFVWGIWWLSLQTVYICSHHKDLCCFSAQTKLPDFTGKPTMEGFPGNETGTVTTLMLFVCHFINWRKQDLTMLHVRWRSTFLYHANTLTAENMIKSCVRAQDLRP